MLESLAALRPTARGLAASAALALSLAAMPAAAAEVTFRSADSPGQMHLVVLSGGDHGTSMIDGTSEDINRARSLLAGGQGLIYFRENGVAYVIRDPALLRRADAILEPQRALGQRQGELGTRQGALGAQQAALGARQAHLGSLQASATPERMGDLGRQQGELSRSQGELDEQQAALGRQQSELGREQERVSRIANANLRSLVNEAIQRGLAQRVD